MKRAKGKYTMKKSGSGKYESYWIYIPKKLAMDLSFPFTDKEEVMVEITEDGLNIKKTNVLHDLIDTTGIKSATLPNLIERKALENKDILTLQLAQWFVTDQVEELEKTKYWLDRCEAFGTDPQLLSELDKEMEEFAE